MLAGQLSDTGFLSHDRVYRRIEAVQEVKSGEISLLMTGQITLW